MSDEKEKKALQEKFENEQKAREREAINALITAKKGRISTTKQTSTSTLEELAEAMYQQTNSRLPNALKGALEGKGAEAAENYLKQLSKPTLKTPVKGA